MNIDCLGIHQFHDQTCW